MAETEHTAPSATSLRSDEPIRSRDDDLLAREHLVHAIADHVGATDAPESVVIALNAPWGAGKSSFLNLLEQRLARPGDEEAPGTSPVIVRFNPWHYGNIDQLVRMFFTELARAIGTAGNQEIAKKIGDALQAIGTLVSVFHSGTGDVIKEGGGRLAADKSLPELKAELDALLRDFPEKIVVFVDDIDRLERDVLRLLFRMVRLNADFPNVTYVLAFDSAVVEKNLDEENGVRGRDYLEKIIQVSFDIPEPERATLHHILFAELDAVLQAVKTRPLDQHRWGNLFFSGFQDHFLTIRQIKRYTNGLRLTLPPVAAEVDPVDFLGVELLRVFHPQVYRYVAKAKDALAPSHESLGYKRDANEVREWTEALCARSGAKSAEQVRGVLRQLFPELARVYENLTYGAGYHSEWRKTCRVCSPEMFDKFFLLAVPRGEISEVELATFVSGLEDAEATAERLRAARASGKARRMLERLEDFIGELPEPHLAPLVRVLFDEGDELRFESRGILDITAEWQVPRLIYQCLKRLSTEQERFEVLLTMVKQGKGLFTVVHEMGMAQPKDEESERQLLSDVGQWEQLRDCALARIRSANESDELWNHERLSFMLFRWLEWGEEGEMSAALATHTTSDEDLVAFAARFVSKNRSHTMGDKVGRVHMKIEKKGLGQLLDLDHTTERLRQIAAKTGELAKAARDLVALLDAKDDPWD